MRDRLTYANVMSTIAVFVVLGGGAYAASKVGSNDIARNAVKSKHVANDALNQKDVKEPLALGYAHIVNGNVVGARSSGVTEVDDNVESVYCLRVKGNPKQAQVTLEDNSVDSVATASLDASSCPAGTEIEIHTGFADGTFANRDFFVLVH